MTKPRVLVFTDYYLPGFKAGGPIASVSRIVEMADQCEFRVVTRDRDLGERVTYKEHEPRTLTTVGKARVLYMSHKFGDWWWLRDQTKKWCPDAYYFNSAHSIFSTVTPLALIMIGVLPKARKVIMAPRGEFGIGALSIKSRKKTIAKRVIRWLIPNTVIWHASSPDEVDQIKSWRGNPNPGESQFVVAPDPAINPADHASTGPTDQTVFTFASRIDRMKGLDRANSIIGIVGRKIPLTWSIQGAVTDSSYLLETKEQIDRLPSSVTVNVRDSFNPDESQYIFSQATAFVFPTLGENFGHVIAEALSVGCPVFVTANTPWTELIQSGAGKLIVSNEQTAIDLAAFAVMTYKDRMIVRERVHVIYKEWFEVHRLTCNPFLFIYP